MRLCWLPAATMTSGIGLGGSFFCLISAGRHKAPPQGHSRGWPLFLRTSRLGKYNCGSGGLHVHVKEERRIFSTGKDLKRVDRLAKAALAKQSEDAMHDSQQAEGLKTILIHYHRRDEKYDSWGLHVWGSSEVQTPWDNALAATGSDDFGVFWKVRAKPTGDLHFLIHRGESKDVSGSVFVSADKSVWLVAGQSSVFLAEPDLSSIPLGNLALAKAFWVSQNLLAWPSAIKGAQFYLHASRKAGLLLTGRGVEGSDEKIKLESDLSGLPAEVEEKFPHIKGYSALRLPEGENIMELVKGQLAVSVDCNGTPLDASGVQLPGVLDDAFAYDGPLGPTFSGNSVHLHVWAPTAQNVRVLLYASPSGGEPQQVLQMKEQNGLWGAVGPTNWKGLYYLFEVTAFHPLTQGIEKMLANDPYSRGLSANGERSLIVDLSEATLQPQGWEGLAFEKPKLEAFNDMAIYELHIRDFSASDETVKPSWRGTYLAFTEQKSAGIAHLKGLAKAGLTHVHLLPSFDFASVDEMKTAWQSVDISTLSALPPYSEEQQAAVMALQDKDGYNWGYDPVNWGVPDGSYATDANGTARIVEFRRMVQGLNNIGLRLILDVVYNHLHANGPTDKYSVLDKVVPGYYLRRNKDGAIENSTCVNNTASEHYMVDRLIIDDLLHWAKDYKVDGFRFDLMGHIMKRTMVRAKKLLRSLTVEHDGVDGSKIYLYGEGWNFGEVANNGRGVNATQHNLAGTGIGSFNDRIRDTALGGSPFGEPLQQGFLTGLSLQPNGLYQGNESELARLLAVTTDWIRLGLAANLSEYVFPNSEGVEVRGCDVLTHDGVPVAYAKSPEELISYVSAHDNETLFDIIMLKTAKEVLLEQRCRINHLASAIVAFGQGIPFFHAGDDMLRSKSLDRDSYNSGDWFNKLNFTYGTNNFGVGLPPKAKNGSKWPMMRELLADPSLKPNKQHIVAAVENFQELLRIRFSSPLFRLRTAAAVQARVRFLNTGPAQYPGAIIMKIEDGDEGKPGLTQLDPSFRQIVVVFNARPARLMADVPAVKGIQLSLHPLQAVSYDAVVRTSSFDVPRGVFEVPARTAAVFVEAR